VNLSLTGVSLLIRHCLYGTVT